MSERGIPLNELRRSSLDLAVLLVFLLAGGVSIILLKVYPVPLPVRIGVPVGIICLYGLLTFMRSRFRLRFDQAGDNCYYMGFIFTLVSLGVALYAIPLGGNVRDFGIGVVRDFGLALATTVVGIMLRVVLNQMREDPHDIEEASRLELIEHSRALSGQMRGSIGLLIDVREDTENRLKNFVYETGQIVAEHQARVEELKNATQALAAQVKRLGDDLKAVDIPTGRLRSAAAETIEVVGSLNTALRQAEADLKRTGVAANAAADSYEKSSRAGTGAAEQGAQFSASMAANAEKSMAAAQGLQRLVESLGTASKGADSYVAMAEELRALTEALKSATRSIGSANTRLSTAEQSLTSQLQLAERAAANLRAQLEALAEVQRQGYAPTSSQAAS